MVATTQFPEITFWNNDAAPLRVVNKRDLQVPKLMQRIGASKRGINVSATSDRDEIIRRQELVQWLLNNPSVQTVLAEQELQPEISSRPSLFLDEFNPERSSSSRFMEQLHAVLAVIDVSEDPPASVQAFANEVRESITNAMNTEGSFATTASDHLQRAAMLSGVVDFVRPAVTKSYVDTNTAVVSGYRLHCHKPLNDRRINLPQWFDEHTWLGAPARRLTEFWNRQYDRVIYGGRVIDTLPETLRQVILQAGREILEADDMENGASWRLQFAFTYQDSELRVKVIDMQVSFEDKYGTVRKAAAGHHRSRILEHNFLTNFPGYSRRQMSRLRRCQRQINKQSAGDHLARVHQAFVHNNLPEGAGEFFSRDGKVVTDSAFEREFRDYALEGLFHQEGPVKVLYQEVLAYRQSVAERVAQLKDLSQVVTNMQKVAQEGDWPLELPQVLESGEHMIRFASLIPTQLLGQKRADGHVLKPEDLVPVADLAKLNGKLVFVTGHNAGGKTVTQETLAETLYLAQCGLPVFGQGVAFNPKEVLAVVFIERGAGSTAELLLQKITDTLAVVSESNPARTLVIIDELGTGTQELDGDHLARQVLARLQSIGCSVLGSTQIMSLAQYAEDELGALMFQVDRERRITPGIGSGDVSGLATRVGLDQYLH